MIAGLRGLSRHVGVAVLVDAGAHEQIEGIVDVVGRQPVFALRLGLGVVAIGVHRKAVGCFIDIGAAAGKQHVVAADGVLENVEHRAFARRRRPHEGALGRVEAVHRARAPAMHELLVVVQVEAVEIGALAAFDLRDAQDLPLQQFDGLAGAGLQSVFEKDAAFAHRTGSRSFGLALVSAARAAAYSRSASRTSAMRSGATPPAMVRSINSSCCWFSRSVITVSAIRRLPGPKSTKSRIQFKQNGAAHRSSARPIISGFCRESSSNSGRMTAVYSRATTNFSTFCVQFCLIAYTQFHRPCRLGALGRAR